MLRAEDIINLTVLKQEGSYWDFKRQWYAKGHEGDMLHDILCMANNLDDRDGYIIIGVDEEQDYIFVDVKEDPCRRNTQMIVDFLRGKKFAGDVRPVVTVEPFLIEGKTIDVIIVHNSNNTPFYLTERFHNIPGPYVYTRIQDTNTPIDKSADIAHVEYLWKKRFGLLLAPIDRIKILLQDKENWVQCTGYNTLQYYKYAPEYTIEYPLDDPEARTGYEFYMLNQINNHPYWTIIQLKYHQTILAEMSGIMLDGGRHFTSCPLHDCVSIKEGRLLDVSYCYYVKDSLEYRVHEFYCEKENMEAIWADSRFMDNILLFETEDEHQLFNYYLEQNGVAGYNKYSKSIREPYIPDIPGYNTEYFKKQITDAKILQKMLDEYRR